MFPLTFVHVFETIMFSDMFFAYIFVCHVSTHVFLKSAVKLTRMCD